MNGMNEARSALAAIPRCGARARSTGETCKQPGVGRGGRCRFHGGASTGPKSKQGRFSSKAVEVRKQLAFLLALIREVHGYTEAPHLRYRGDLADVERRLAAFLKKRSG